MSFAEIVAVVVGGVVIAAALCWCAVMVGLRLERRRKARAAGREKSVKRADVP